MQKDSQGNRGIQLLVEKYRKQFRIPENLKYYRKKDFKVAERKFLKLALLGRKLKA